MVDRNLSEFYTRVDRIERAHKKGYGFEALGTLGRSHYTKRRAPRTPVLAPLLFVVFGVMAFKAVIHQGVGAQDYEERVAALWLGDSTERISAALMQADPVTLWMSAQIGKLIH